MSEPITNKPPIEHKYEPTIKDRFDDVVDFVKNIPWEIWWRVRNVYRNVRRLCSWIPIIWNDRDWDSYYLLIIIRHKLQSVHESSKHWNWVGSEKATEQLQQCLDDLDKLLDQDDLYVFTKREHAEFVEKYGELVCWSTPTNDSVYEVHTSYSKCDTQQLADEADRKSTQIDKLNEKRRKQANDRLWNTIRNNHESWWD